MERQHIGKGISMSNKINGSRSKWPKPDSKLGEQRNIFQIHTKN
jgi:hypothetical protein